MDSKRLRAWYSKKQGLDGSLKGASPAAILEKTGWARSVGGVNPYITLFARAGISRQAADDAAAKLLIHELPAARGCTYVVPASDFALALTVGQGFGDESEIQIATKYLKVTELEIDKLCDAVLEVLKEGQKDPRKLKDALGNLVRSLGEEGKKRGISTTLPLALGRLQAHGQIRRVSLNGRLDQQRYAYALWKPSPLAKQKWRRNEAALELARRYFQWIGPASIKAFQWFSGFSMKDTKEAVTALKCVPVEADSELLMLPDELDAFQSFRVPSKPSYSLVSSLDNMMHLRRDVSSLTESSDQEREVLRINKNALQDLPNFGILDRGRLIGLWEFEASSGKIVSNSFLNVDKDLKAAIAKTEIFVREELGDARSFSLDTPESRAPRIAALRA